MVELSGGHIVVGGQQAPTRQGLQGIHHLDGANGRVRDCKDGRSNSLWAFALLCGSTASTTETIRSGRGHTIRIVQILIYTTDKSQDIDQRASSPSLSVSVFETSSACSKSGTPPRLQPPPSQAVTHAISTLLTRAFTASVSIPLYYLDTYITSTVPVHPTLPLAPGLPTMLSRPERTRVGTERDRPFFAWAMRRGIDPFTQRTRALYLHTLGRITPALSTKKLHPRRPVR